MNNNRSTEKPNEATTQPAPGNKWFELYRILLFLIFGLAFVVFIILLFISSGDKAALIAGILVMAGVLLVVVLLPAIAELSIGPTGVRAILSQVQVTVEKQGEQLAEQQKILNNLTEFSMSASIFRHLCGIACLYEYHYEHGEAFAREMYFLRDNGFISPKSGGFLDFNSGLDKRNLVDIAEPTPIGWDIVRLRKSEAQWIQPNKPNTRVDPATL